MGGTWPELAAIARAAACCAAVPTGVADVKNGVFALEVVVNACEYAYVVVFGGLLLACADFPRCTDFSNGDPEVLHLLHKKG